jgi:hypothetical protein
VHANTGGRTYVGHNSWHMRYNNPINPNPSKFLYRIGPWLFFRAIQKIDVTLGGEGSKKLSF